MSSTLVTIGVLLVIIVPIALLVFKAVQQGIATGEHFSESGVSYSSVVSRISHWTPLEQFVSPEAAEKQIKSWVQGAGKAASTGILGAIANLPEIGLQLALALIACYFFLIDGPGFLQWLSDKIPLDTDVRQKVSKSLKDTSISVVWATLAAAALQAVVMGIAYATLGVPGIFLAAGATFIFAWIPILGSTPVWLVGAGYLYSQDSPGRMVIMLLLGGFASVVDNFVRPLVLKGRSEMHPLVSLVAIFGGIEMFGIMGVFIGPIVVDVMIALLEMWPGVGRRFGILGYESGHIERVD